MTGSRATEATGSHPSESDRAGVVLAGGFSRRFGERDKALVPVDGEPMVARVVRRLSAVVSRVVVSCRAEQRDPIAGALDAIDARAPVSFALDDQPDRGPLAGLRDALSIVDAEYAAVVACDLPGLDPEFVEFLFDRAEGGDAAVPERSDGHLLPTHAVLRVDPTHSIAARLLADDRRSLHAALEELDAAVVPADVVASRTDPAALFDVDSPEDLEAFLDARCRDS